MSHDGRLVRKLLILVNMKCVGSAMTLTQWAAKTPPTYGSGDSV